MIATVLLAAALMAPGEAELRARLPEIFAKSAAHYKALDAAATPLMRDGKGELRLPHGWLNWKGRRELSMLSIFGWTAGHFPGSLWYLYEATGDVFFRDRATARTEILEPNKTVDSNHDVGFIMYCSFGNARRILKTDKYDAILAETAASLSRRFNESLGLIRSWGKADDTTDFLVIPDNLMNLELLEAASKISGNPRFDQIARSHATVTMKRHFRTDGGTYHVLNYDQRPGFVGSVQEIRRGQGRSGLTAWSRGQSWAIYGYTMMYRETKDPAYLAFAQKVSDYAINHPNMPADGVPYWDYGAPGEERDSSAASIMASGLLELAGFVGGEKGAAYRAFAVKQLLSLASSDYFSEGDEIGHFLLKHGVGNKPRSSEVDTPLDYGDYYFLEALLRFRDGESGAQGSAAGSQGAFGKSAYLDIMEQAVRAYTPERLEAFIRSVEKRGIYEHGFPRLAANLGVLLARGRLDEKRSLLVRMMDLCAREMPLALKRGNRFAGNDFAVREVVCMLDELARSGRFPEETVARWQRAFAPLAAEEIYTCQPEPGGKRAANWCVFGAASEQARLKYGLGGNEAYVERYVADQLRFFDENGMYCDPGQPMVYDFVTRLQFAMVLALGYDGPSRARLEAELLKSADATLAMQSVTGEIPYGGRSNQFLHNETFCAALCEFYAGWFKARGDLARARRFRGAARRAVESLRYWTALEDVRHVKNRFPIASGYGCEDYACFDKYMVTMGSWAYLAYRLADESVVPADEPEPDSTFVTSEMFHRIMVNAGDYTVQYDWNAQQGHDANGLGRFQRRGAPPFLGLSSPFSQTPHYRIDVTNDTDLAVGPSGWPSFTLVLAEKGACTFRCGGAEWRSGLSREGLDMVLSGMGEQTMSLPAFVTDGERTSRIDAGTNVLEIAFGGWRCRYETDGRLVDTGRIYGNRNGHYRRFDVRGDGTVRVRARLIR